MQRKVLKIGLCINLSKEFVPHHLLCFNDLSQRCTRHFTLNNNDKVTPQISTRISLYEFCTTLFCAAVISGENRLPNSPAKSKEVILNIQETGLQEQKI